MKLEEAKEILKTFKTRQKTINYNKISLEDVEAISTVLQALDNAIPKEKVRAKLKNVEENAYWNFLKERDAEKTVEILNELLEE